MDDLALFRTKDKDKDMSALAAKAAPLKHGPADFYPGEHRLDEQLMGMANQVEDIVQEARREDPTKKKSKASLLGHATVKVVETQAQKAARFFATHGMKKVGQMLGQELSVSEEQALRKSRPSHAVQAPVVEDFEMPQDDEEIAYKKQWAAVDALKKRKINL